MKIKKELIGASTWLLILKVLVKNPNYGYKIVKSVNETADNFFVWQEGTIYPVLRKLEKEDMLSSQWEYADNGRKRKYYYITAKGREALTQGTTEWKGFYQLIMRTAEVPGV